MLWGQKTLFKIGEHGILPCAICTWRWACVCSVDFVYALSTLRTWPLIKKTLTNLLKYKNSCLSLKHSPMYFQPRKHLFEVPQWQKILLLISPLGLGSLVLILRISLLPMVFLASSLLIPYFFCPWFACWTPKNPKILFSLHIQNDMAQPVWTLEHPKCFFQLKWPKCP